LQPRARWRREYAGWPALAKLEYVDALMREITARKPRRQSRRQIDPVVQSSRTLRQHYRGKASRYLLEDDRYDTALRRIFSTGADQRHPGAASFLRSVERQVERLLVRRADLHPYVIEHAMEMLIHRCAEMHLQLRHDRRSAKRDFQRLVRRVAFEVLRKNRESYAL
jgi:hypothetical protein